MVTRMLKSDFIKYIKDNQNVKIWLYFLCCSVSQLRGGRFFCTFLNNYIKTFQAKLIFMSLLPCVMFLSDFGVDCWVPAGWVGWGIWFAARSEGWLGGNHLALEWSKLLGGMSKHRTKSASMWKSSLQVSTVFSMLYVYFTSLSHWHIPINQSTNKGTRQFQVGICSVKRLKGMGC